MVRAASRSVASGTVTRAGRVQAAHRVAAALAVARTAAHERPEGGLLLEQVLLREHADECAVDVDHGRALHAPVDEQERRRAQRQALVEHHRVGGHDVTHTQDERRAAGRLGGGWRAFGCERLEPLAEPSGERHDHALRRGAEGEAVDGGAEQPERHRVGADDGQLRVAVRKRLELDRAVERRIGVAARVGVPGEWDARPPVSLGRHPGGRLHLLRRPGARHVGGELQWKGAVDGRGARRRARRLPQ
jgi:hypothetical protein